MQILRGLIPAITQSLEAANYIKINEKNNKLIGSVELIAFKKGYIDINEFNNLIDKLGNNEYSELLKNYKMKFKNPLQNLLFLT